MRTARVHERSQDLTRTIRLPTAALLRFSCLVVLVALTCVSVGSSGDLDIRRSSSTGADAPRPSGEWDNGCARRFHGASKERNGRPAAGYWQAPDSEVAHRGSMFVCGRRNRRQDPDSDVVRNGQRATDGATGSR